MIRVALVDRPGSGAPGFAVLQAIAAALTRQVNEHFAPAWNVGPVAVVADTKPLATDWVIELVKDMDQPGALGDHGMTPHGLPHALVAPLLDAQDGANLSTTISHELLEMLADPYLSRATQAHDGKFWALEVADAVEDDEYEIDGVKVSNFVTPHYFEPPRSLVGVKLDQLGLVKKPLEVRPGGYMQWSDGSGWHQVTHAELAPRAYRGLGTSRSARRVLR